MVMSAGSAESLSAWRDAAQTVQSWQPLFGC